MLREGSFPKSSFQEILKTIPPPLRARRPFATYAILSTAKKWMSSWAGPCTSGGPPSMRARRVSQRLRPAAAAELSSGTITLRRPRVSGLDERFESRLLPAFKRRTEEVGRLLPDLYLISVA
jgi:hypothetical protein